MNNEEISGTFQTTSEGSTLSIASGASGFFVGGLGGNYQLSQDTCNQALQQSKFKYQEDQFLDSLKKYLESTYSQHYVGTGKNKVQIFDLCESAEEMLPFSRWSAITYLFRFGKKGGNNITDLFKAIHYIIMMWYTTRPQTLVSNNLPNNQYIIINEQNPPNISLNKI